MVALGHGDDLAGVLDRERALVGAVGKRGEGEEVVALEDERIHLELGEAADLLAEIVLLDDAAEALLAALDVHAAKLELRPIADAHARQDALRGIDAAELAHSLSGV
jgi:hypothetical protein